MKKLTKILTFVTFTVLVVLCLASCDQLLSNGVSDHDHEYGDWGTDTATCENGGEQTRFCTICNHKQTRKTGALGHDYVTYKDRAPTCTESGYTNYQKCSRCDDEKGTTVDPFGHSMSAWTGNTATCIAGGKEFAECSVCGFDDERATKPLGHNIDASHECLTCHKKDIIVLVKDGKANFDVVFTSKSAGLANSFVQKIRALGIEINDAIHDSKKPTNEYEIIIGADAANRGEDCSVGEKYLGNKGTAVKIVGNKIIIAGGSTELTSSAFETFKSEVLGITNDTKTIEYLEVDSTCCYEKLTQYAISSITIGGIDLSNFGYVRDVSGVANGYNLSDINDFHDELYDISGVWMSHVDAAMMVEGKNYFIVRYVADAGEDGFRAYFDGKNFIVECAYQNMFNDAFAEFADKNFLNKSGTVEIASSFTYEKLVSVVYYEDFNAKGNGTTCDYEAIYNTHIFANAGGQKVMSRGGSDAVYYISAENFIKTVPVKTNVDFCGATFIVNDLGQSAYTNRKLALFTLTSDYARVSFGDNDKSIPQESIDKDGNPVITYVSDDVVDDERFKDITFKAGETDFSWLKDELVGTKNLVMIWNEKHKDFVRHGSNQNSGATRREIFVVNADGTVDANTAPAFDFDNISVIHIYRADDKPITVENGNFINICCRAVERTVNANTPEEYKTYANAFHEYQRGFIVNRSNSTIKNVTHKMQDEPDLGWYPVGSDYDPDSAINTDTYGSRFESYPYYGFVFVNYCYNFSLLDSQLTGHSTYYEDKPATASTGGIKPPPVAMGSYDFVLEYCSDITFTNVTQVNKESQQASADAGDYSFLTDTRYWGIMSSNGGKNYTFTGCKINRFDAHRGFWNATIKDSYIGHSLQIIGGGELKVENVTKGTKSNFMMFRSDYGSTFDGNIVVKDCKHEARTSYNSWKADQQSPKAIGSYTGNIVIFSCDYYTESKGWSESDPSGGYWVWDFGYTCYMPRTVEIDNFKYLGTKKVYVFNNLTDAVFTKNYVEGQPITKLTVKYPYQITEKIIQKNMSAVIPTCQSNASNYSKMNAIEVDDTGIK